MQAKKAKQLLKARLCRERQIYEMRKRAELRAAVSELERPWEVVERAPNLLSVSADEQLKVLADRFQKPGGFDLWTENDGPQLFQTPDELPSARFFPKGVVHSVKPYRRVSETEELGSEDEDRGPELSDVESLNSKISDGLRMESRRNLGSSDLSDSENIRFQESDLEVGSHGQLGEQRNGNNSRFYGRKSSDRSRSFNGRELDNGEVREPESLNLNSSDGFRRKEHRRTFWSYDSNGSCRSDWEQLSLDELDLESGNHGQLGVHKSWNNRQSYGRKFSGRLRYFSGGEVENGKLSKPESLNWKSSFGPRRNRSRSRFQSSDCSGWSNSERPAYDRKQRGKGRPFQRSRRNGSSKLNVSENGVYDMSLRQDGSCGSQ